MSAVGSKQSATTPQNQFSRASFPTLFSSLGTQNSALSFPTLFDCPLPTANCFHFLPSALSTRKPAHCPLPTVFTFFPQHSALRTRKPANCQLPTANSLLFDCQLFPFSLSTQHSALSFPTLFSSTAHFPDFPLTPLFLNFGKSYHAIPEEGASEWQYHIHKPTE